MRIVITPPAVEPVSLEQARDHCRISTLDLDSTLESAITVARELVELFSGRQCVEATFEEHLDGFADVMRLRPSPLISVSSIKYDDADGAEQTLSTSLYSVDSASEPARVYRAHGAQWPTLAPGKFNRVRIRYTAGYALAAGQPTTPVALRLWMLLTIAALVDNPSSLIVDAGAANLAQLPHRYYDGLIDSYRVPRL